MPDLDYRNHNFHKDHLHPLSSFKPKAIEEMGLDETTKQCYLSKEWNNSIINLQMLDSNENKAKQDKSLSDWVELESETKDRSLLLARCLIPSDIDLGFDNFVEFTEKRKDLLKQKLIDILK